MRRLLSFDCAGETLAASLDDAGGETGILLVTGGSQTRIGSHRMYERLSISLSKTGFSCLRYDRRGVGDSSGSDPGYLASGPDITAAAAAFRAAAPGVRSLFGFGLCDGASALALFGAKAGLSGIIMVNPWLVEAGTHTPPPAAIRDHYRRRLLSRDGWLKIISGSVDYRKILRGLGTILKRSDENRLAAEIAVSLTEGRIRTEVILAEADATAVAAAAELRKKAFRGRIARIQRIASDSHTFARLGDEAILAEAVIDAVRRLEV